MRKIYTVIEWNRNFGHMLEKSFFNRIKEIYSDETEEEIRKVIRKNFNSMDLDGLRYRSESYSDLQLCQFVEGSFARTFNVIPKKRTWWQATKKIFQRIWRIVERGQ